MVFSIGEWYIGRTSRRPASIMPVPPSWLRYAVLFAVVVALAWAGWYITRPGPLEVGVTALARGPVEATVVNTRAGTVSACRRARLAPAAGGQIVRLFVKEGQRVEAGQPLLELWNRDLAAQRELAQRQLATSVERRREACILAGNARQDALRDEQLAAQGFVSPQRTGDSRANARARQANCDALAADVKRAQAQIDVTRAGLERTTLSAPFAGIVAQVTGEVGEFTTPSPPGIPTPPAVDLIDDSCVYVTAPMDEVDAPRLKPGQPARITLDALPGRIFRGRVRRIAPYVSEVEKQARTVDVEVDFADAEHRPLRVGYSADAEVIIARRADVLRVPTQAIRQDGSVLVLGADGMLSSRAFRAGLANWAYTEVLDGLAAGDRVVTDFDSEAIAAGARAVAKPLK
jgi:HlyD family secretion protein